LVGIYQKPGSRELYTATYNTIYEIDGSTVNIIKQIPVDKEIFKYDPLDIGNKWVYNGKFIVAEETSDFVCSREAIKDTVLADQKTFIQIKNIYLDSISRNVTYSYERIDSSNGKVYFWNKNNETEYQVDDLSINQGDTINFSRFGNNGVPTSFDSLNTKSIFGLLEENHVYNSPNSAILYGDTYYLTKDFGMTYHISGADPVFFIYNLKGTIIKGVFYGDTSFIAGIKDKGLNQPNEFVLSQNYPNPFNPLTIIKYGIKEKANVKLTVYDILGREIKTLLNETKEPGNYQIQFDGTGMVSGVYFYRLTTKQFEKCRKMILMK